MNQADPSVDELNISTDMREGVIQPGAPDTPAIPTDDGTFEVKLDGKPFRVPREELVSGYQRMKDYTQKTMKLAEERRAWETERASVYKQVEELKTWLQDPANLQQYYQQLIQQRGYENPDTPLTASQAQQLVQAQLEKEREQLRQAFINQRQNILQETQAMSYLAEVNATIKGLQETYPELAVVDGIDALLYRDVANMNPQSFDEVKQGFAQAAKNRAEKIRAHFNEQRKRDVTQSNRLAQAMEPPGSAGVPAVPPPKFKLGDKALVHAVMEDLLAAAKEG